MAGLRPLICEGGATVPSPPSLGDMAFPTTAALSVVGLSHSPVLLCAQHFALSGMTSYLIFVYDPVVWGCPGRSLLVYPGPRPGPGILQPQSLELLWSWVVGRK